MVAWYPFNGNANDESGNGHNGVINGATLTTDRDSNGSSAYYFNGDFITVADHPDFDFTSKMSISVWFTVDAGQTFDWDGILSKFPASTTTSDGYALRMDRSETSSQILKVNIPPGDPTYHAGDFNSDSNLWHHAVLTIDGSSRKLYVDGSLSVDRADNSAITTNNNPITIGGQNGSYRSWKGKIDDVAIWESALTEKEIQNIYKATATPTPQVIRVAKDGTKEFTTIQGGVDNAAVNDTVLVYPGNYTENINYGGNDIVIRSVDGPSDTVIEPLNTGITAVWFTGGETSSAILDGFTIRNGGDVRGSGINIQGADPTISNIILLDNGGEAAINSWNSSPYIKNCIIDGSNTSIFFDTNPATPVINHCTLISGLINNQSYTPVVNNSIILNGATGNLNINNSIVEGGFIGDNNFDLNPLIKDIESGDYSLSDYSPAIGAGDPFVNITTDIDGTTRPNPSGSNPDIGAYESALAGPLEFPAPDSVTASGGEFSISFEWNYDSSLSSIAEGFYIYRSNSLNNMSIIDSTASQSYVDSTITPGNSYYYAIAMYAADGRSSPISEAFQISSEDNSPPTATIFTAELINYEAIQLSWLESTVPDLSGYKLYRSRTDTNSFALHAELGLVQEYIDESIEYGSTYYYKLTAFDSTGNESEPTQISIQVADTIAPSTPEILSNTVTNGSVSIYWSEVSDADLGYFQIYRGGTSDGLDSLDTVQNTLTQYTDQSVENGQTYYYRVSAFDTLGNESNLSEMVEASPNNVNPRAVQIEDQFYRDISDSVVTVNLTAEGSTDADGTIDSTFWYLDENLLSKSFQTDFNAPQGTSDLQLVVMDNNGGTDTTSFAINVSAGYRSFDNQNADNAGISLIGNNYLFYPLSGGFMQILDGAFTDRFDLSVGGEIRSVSSIASDTTVYLASTDRVVYSYDRRGIPLWDTPLGGDLQATPTIDPQRDMIYVGVSNSNLFAVDRSSGDVVWSYRLQNPLTEPGIILENRYLLIITEQGEASYFDLDAPVTNQELTPAGSIELADSLSTAPAVNSDGYIFASTSSGKLIKFEFRDDITGGGQIIWETQTNGEFNASPVIGYDGTVYVGSSDSTLYAFDDADGSIKWGFNTDAAIATTATINPFGVIYVGDESGKIYSIDESGNQLWYYTSGGPVGNAMAYSDGHIIFSTLNGEIFKVYDGWRFQVQAKASKAQNKSPQWGTYQANNRRSGNSMDQIATSTEDQLEEIPGEYSMTQNYPNPFNPSTRINYAISKQTLVRINVYNTLGQRVATLVDDRKNAGRHSINFDASRLSSGVYFYTIQAGDFQKTMKMLLIK